MADLKTYVRERDAALLSMDYKSILEHFDRHGLEISTTDPDAFWATVHKARTAARTLPMEARQESKRWLTAHGLASMDDGELS